MISASEVFSAAHRCFPKVPQRHLICVTLHVQRALDVLIFGQGAKNKCKNSKTTLLNTCGRCLGWYQRTQKREECHG